MFCFHNLIVSVLLIVCMLGVVCCLGCVICGLCCHVCVMVVRCFCFVVCRLPCLVMVAFSLNVCVGCCATCHVWWVMFEVLCNVFILCLKIVVCGLSGITGRG